MGFAPPPRGGFAFLAAPERQSARERAYQLGVGRYICHMAIYPELGEPAVCQVVIPCWANFLELRHGEVRRIYLLGTWVNRGIRKNGSLTLLDFARGVELLPHQQQQITLLG
jgi:hypothetical protein